MRALQLLAITSLLLLAACEDRPAPPSRGEAPPAPAAAPAAPPAEPGALQGVVRVTGKVPPQPPLTTNSAVERTCGKQVADETLRVAAGGALADAVVFLADAPKAGRDPGTLVVALDQRRCAFAPAVIVGRAGATLEIHNSDPLVHNVRAVNGQQTWINVAMPLEGMTLKRTLPAAAGVWRVHCDVHPWMRGTLRTFEHDAFAVTGPDGRFELPALPAGKRRVAVWHPRFPEQTFEVEITPGRTAQLEASWAVEQLSPR